MRQVKHRQFHGSHALLLGFLLVVASAAAAEPPVPRQLTIGTKESPPFAMKRADGSWHGISIDLWKQVADQLGLAYRFREQDLAGLVEGVKSGRLDAAVAAVTATPEREMAFDFSYPFYTSGLGIAAATGGSGVWAQMKPLFSPALGKAVAALGFALLAVGVVVWQLERRRNPGQFGGSPAQGIGAGFWWSSVTMTTVGYGDKAPVTFAGRLLAVVWMFASLLLVSTFTGAIASALTVGQLAGAIQGPEDLPKVRVGTVGDSTSEAYLRSKQIQYRTFGQIPDGLRALADGDIDAMVYDAPLLRYHVARDFDDQLQVLPQTFRRQDYAIALPTNSRLREGINRSLLQLIQAPAWDDTLYRYLGGRR